MFKKILISIEDIHQPGSAPAMARELSAKDGSSMTLLHVVDIDSLDRPEVSHEIENPTSTGLKDDTSRTAGTLAVDETMTASAARPGQEEQPVGIGSRLVEDNLELVRNQLSGMASELSSGKAKVSAKVVAGDADEEIRREIDTGDYDLAVVVHQKTGFLQRLFSSSTTGEVLKDAEIPVLVVTSGEKEQQESDGGFSHLVAIVDTKSEGSESADAALELARQYKLPVTFIVNAEPPVPAASHPAPGAIEISASQIEQEHMLAKESIRDLVNAAGQDGIQASSTVVFTGLVGETRRITAELPRPLLITEGSDGFSLARALMGSETEQLARGINAPVLNIPTTWKPAETEEAK